MIYLIYGKDKFLIKKEINNIINNEQINDISHNNYDLNNTTLNEIIDDAQTISLFDIKKLITIDNSYIFTSKKGNIEQNIDLLGQYLKKPNPDTIIIFTTDEEKLDERKKIVKTIKQNGKIIECNEINNLHQYLKELFNEYKITDRTIELLIDRVGKNIAILEQEINKIKTYKHDDLNITDDDIINLTNKTIDIDIFVLIENIVNKNKEKAITIYHEMLKYNEEPIKVIVMLANQFRIIYQATTMLKQGYTEADIAKTLDIHPYRIKLAIQKGREYSNSTLLGYLEQLADLDINIKKGIIDKEIGLELFILKA